MKNVAKTGKFPRVRSREEQQCIISRLFVYKRPYDSGENPNMEQSILTTTFNPYKFTKQYEHSFSFHSPTKRHMSPPNHLIHQFVHQPTD